MPPGKHNQPHNNPYASAAGAYGTNAQKNSSDPREVEARVLLKSAKLMQDLQTDWDSVNPDLLHETLKYNRSIWLMFSDTAIEAKPGERPQDLRNNIFNLANFVFKRESEIMATPEKQKLDILIKINRDIAAGLMTSMENDARKNASSPAPSGEDTKNPPIGGTDRSA